MWNRTQNRLHGTDGFFHIAHEGMDLLSYFETQHILLKSGSMSMTEYNALIPWQLDVILSLMKRDQEEKMEKARNQASRNHGM